MNPKVLVAMLCLVGMCVIGCIQTPPAPEPPVQIDPFDIQPATPNCPPGYCPDGQCPLGPQDANGTEVSSELSLGDTVGINELAANEVKQATSPATDGCLPCQPSARQPTVSKGDDAKHGAYQCEACKRPTVGQGWQDLWTDDGMSLHCICTECFEKSSPSQREAVITGFLRRSDPNLLADPSVKAAVRSISAN
jgi:hypothetical protein